MNPSCRALHLDGVRDSHAGAMPADFCPLTALVIIDMQKGMLSAGSRNNPDAESHVASLLSHWRERCLPIVHVRHLSRSPGSPFCPGQPGAEFQDLLAPLASEHIVDKHVTDAFAHSGLG